MQITTDNSHQPIASLDAIEVLRVTQVSRLADCPRGWKAVMLGEGERGNSTSSKVGTAVHNACERVLDGSLDPDADWCQIALYLEGEGVCKDERAHARRYLAELHHQATNAPALAIEHAFEIAVVPGAPRVRGHIDSVFAFGDVIVIRDHKTNRQPREAAWWAAQWQPRLYAYAARRLWPGKPVYFQIGYVNLNQVVEWGCPESDDARVEADYAHLWECVRGFRHWDSWPERVNESCRWCPVRRGCATHQASVKKFLGPFAKAETPASRQAQYDEARASLRALAVTVEEMRVELEAHP